VTGVTTDSIAMRGAGVVHIVQPAKGHRFTLDSILLADFCPIRPGDRVLEPGAGTGIISLLLAKKHPRAAFTAVEVQPALAGFCGQNIMNNGLSGRIALLGRDLRGLRRSSGSCPFSVIVANPPYIKEGTGRTSPDPVRQSARHDVSASLDAWLDLQRLLGQGGRYLLVFPASRLGELTALMMKRRLELKRMRFVHPFQNRSASLVLLEAVKEGGSGMEVLPPLFVHEPGGGYSREMKNIYGSSADR
jgi:tRNA1(Val) A37 N6-methylase TrmN6